MNRRKAIFRITLAGIGLAGAGAAYEWWTLVRSPDMPWLRNNKELIAALSESIIPATDSPGAREAGVADFIIKMITSCTPVKEQNTFISGLKAMQDRCRSKYGKPFQHCAPADQEAALLYFEQKGQPFKGAAGKLEARLTGRSFFRILKDYTVEGYCTSSAGATKGLAYLYIPGSFHGCIPLQPAQKGWATN